MPRAYKEHSPEWDAYWAEQRKIADSVFKDMPRHDPFAEMQRKADQLTKDLKEAEQRVEQAKS